jgi:hypothetical protein
MKHFKPSLAKFVAAAVVMIVMAVAASWNLYFFVVFRNAVGLQDTWGGKYHLLLASAAMLTAIVAAWLMFVFFPGSGRNESHETPLSPLEPRPAPINNSLNNPTKPEQVNHITWAQQNEWWAEGQSNDRQPMSGSAGASAGSASAKRSTARLMHQLMYRKWARKRHD